MNYLIVGLGNIGSEYADTRHNIGFMVADELVKQVGASFSLLKLAYYSEFKQRGHNVTVIKPTTYMNLSGKAVNYYMQQCKVPIQNVLVIVDDLAIPFGSLRMKPKGSSAGHNGLKSIEQLCGGQVYPRLRFGIGDNYPKGRQVDYVLGPFDKEEQAELPALIDHSVKMIQSFVNIGIELTMTNLNTK
ncbi:Peptidyl-tRNA hydrolase [compost metagenome]|jgi:PTH1 family peptidyl-tRNA hydrolase|uniref:aminoacyl-tRNA hydrolase n=1 Tax=unclassified Sphingobacterium TaxID=2609468 RepID=UPI000FAC7FE7|nr:MULTISPECIES: aminoacyl-tRNA hydrolase [unclassified Sphingobacterium]MBB1644097.1 aminoacyl-tRNA hydrolase [Sphingobacterium sp. UME9]MCS4168197.1 PTH1 family peptidyl-tRNA hydrolase [Sphingobacterium sp. BIGb0116]WET71544.1 MAG: aminoacyl-tRNA hydrolase [Sphingobacterium sp.]